VSDLFASIGSILLFCGGMTCASSPAKAVVRSRRSPPGTLSRPPVFLVLSWLWHERVSAMLPINGLLLPLGPL